VIFEKIGGIFGFGGGFFLNGVQMLYGD